MATNQTESLLAEANNDFGLKFYLELAKERGNVFFSPFSVSVSLSMLLRGAGGETAVEMKQILGFENVKLDGSQIHQSFRQLLDVIVENQELYTLTVANAIVTQKHFAIFPDYVADLQDIYKALIMEVDFATESSHAVNKINQWVNENTKGKIPIILQILDPATVVILLNAVYFKGTWEYPFNPDNTKEGLFYNIRSASKKVPLMYMCTWFPFLEKKKYKALQLPYLGDNIAMLLLLPNKKDGLEKFKKSLTPGLLHQIQNELVEMKVRVTLPKLHLEYSKELLPVLKALGVTRLFKEGADLRGLSDSPELCVSDVIHKAVLDVNEEGSEAASVTGGCIYPTSCSPRTPPEFKADHPFLFIIYHERNNLILFMGQVEEL